MMEVLAEILVQFVGEILLGFVVEVIPDWIVKRIRKGKGRTTKDRTTLYLPPSYQADLRNRQGGDLITCLQCGYVRLSLEKTCLRCAYLSKPPLKLEACRDMMH